MTHGRSLPSTFLKRTRANRKKLLTRGEKKGRAFSGVVTQPPASETAVCRAAAFYRRDIPPSMHRQTNFRGPELDRAAVVTEEINAKRENRRNASRASHDLTRPRGL